MKSILKWMYKVLIGFEYDQKFADPSSCLNFDGEPMTYEEWSRNIDETFGK